MDNKITIIKILNGQKPIDYLDKSLNSGDEYYYSISKEDTLVVSSHNGLECNVVFVIFEKNDTEKRDDILSLYIGRGNICQKNTWWVINYKIKKKIDSPFVIHDFISNSELDVRNDFESYSYVNIEVAPELIAQISSILQPLYEIPYVPIDQQDYPEIHFEQHLHPYSQFNSHCLRPIGHTYPQEMRGEYQRDYERIVHSKAYRRLVDKAQIFTSTKGDYYRTRMTHTLEVAQIARAIAIGLNINIHLTEAIALAHDLGHTPFGHQGERTLDSILKNRLEIIQAIPEERNFYGGFKHNFQTLRVVNYLEEKYVDFPGIDLSYQVLEGALKHTKTVIKDCVNCSDDENCSEKCYNIKEFLPIGEINHLYLEYSFPTTLEGQIVAIADEIAQRSHDLDDSFAAQLLTTKNLIEYLSLQKMSELRERVANIESEVIDSQEKNRQFVDVNELKHSCIVSAIINFFINDVIAISSRNIKNFEEDDLYKEQHRFSKRLVSFSFNGKILCDYLEKIISKKVINSPDVVQFDSRAEQIVSGLFHAYYNNPKLLHKGTLRRIFIETNSKCENAIDFQNGDHTVVKKEIERIVKANLKELFNDGFISESEKNNYEQKRKILVRSIADFISGMTDSYAINEYRKIFQP